MLIRLFRGLALLAVVLSACFLGACGGSEAPDTPTDPQQEVVRAQHSAQSAGLHDYCAATGTALARPVTDAGFQLQGPNAIAGQGDLVLASSKAMFVISGMGPQKTYYHYPGILVDAVAMADCEQQSQDHFYELPLMVGKLNVANTSRSTFRAFQAQQIEVINDGRNGEAAVVRATGVDNVYWLLELELMKQAALDGFPKYLSEPFDLRIEVDYILEPESPTLQIKYRLINTRDSFNGFSIAFVLMASGEGAPLSRFSAFDLNLNDASLGLDIGLALEHGIPWISTRDTENAYVYSARTNALTTTEISGVSAILDARQLANTYLGQFLMPAGTQGDSALQEFDVTVVAGDEFRAVKQHIQHTPMRTRLVETPLHIRVTDSLSGEPIPGARLQFQTKKQIFLQGWPWETFLTAHADANGEFNDAVPLVRYLENQAYRVLVSVPGRADSVPVSIQRGDLVAGAVQQLEVELQGTGALEYALVDQDGKPSPGKITLFRAGKIVDRIYSATGSGIHPVPPGHYQVIVSRGFEYGVEESDIEILPYANTPLNVALKHWVNTDGYLSYDGHVHSSPSPDGKANHVERIRTVAAEGLDIVVATDHEILTDLAPAVIEAGAQAFVGTIIGQEVTAALPNHTTAFPMNRDPAKTRDFVSWYGLDIGQIFAAEKAAGARIRTFAHPRSSYLDVIGWDRIAGAPGIDFDPRHMGRPADASLWSWDFEAMELLNGVQNVFASGIFEDWMSFLNHGHRIIATGASDVHGDEAPGTPRTYFRSSTDSAPQFDIDEMVDSIIGGDVVVSLGAFARVQVNAVAGLGDTVTDQDGSVDVQLQVEAIPQIDVDHVRIYVNCDEVARVPMQNPVDSAIKFSGTLAIPVPTDRDAHVVVMGFGQQPLPAVFEQFDATEVPRFVTNPVFIDTDGNGEYDAPGGKACRL